MVSRTNNLLSLLDTLTFSDSSEKAFSINDERIKNELKRAKALIQEIEIENRREKERTQSVLDSGGTKP